MNCRIPFFNKNKMKTIFDTSQEKTNILISHFFSSLARSGEKFVLGCGLVHLGQEFDCHAIDVYLKRHTRVEASQNVSLDIIMLVGYCNSIPLLLHKFFQKY